MLHSLSLRVLSSILLILSHSATVLSLPRASPEDRGSDGTCSDPVIAVSTATKIKQGPYLVLGARSDANPGGGLFLLYNIN